MPVTATPRGEAAFARAALKGLVTRVVGRTVTLTADEARAMRQPAGERVLMLRAQSHDTLLLNAPLALKSAAAGALPTRFSGVAYSGGFVPDFGVVIDLGSTKFNPTLPLLNSHDRGDIIGVIEQATTKDHRMVVGGRLFSDMPASPAERIAQLAQRGAPFEMSVGLYSYTREAVPAGKSATVNGKTFHGPINVLRNGQVREVSIVTLGADPRTAVAVFGG